ncbi:response regulator [Flavobacterium sp. PLA-1-15]|uniref:response regulator n=1 Tax=Flavobacterium sp. PLA-1-15 TaxID=3380533 RepID=UPI003B797146
MKKNVTLFYADDDADDLDFFRDVTEAIDKNIEVFTHDNGNQLLVAVKNPPPSPHIIFLDLNMPGKDGFEVLRELKTSEEYKNIPVVIFSTSNDQKNILRSKELGANLYITKPNSFAKFRKSIEHTLSINWDVFKPSLESFCYSC